jgi:hypothetical protein
MSILRRTILALTTFVILGAAASVLWLPSPVHASPNGGTSSADVPYADRIVQNCQPTDRCLVGQVIFVAGFAIGIYQAGKVGQRLRKKRRDRREKEESKDVTLR